MNENNFCKRVSFLTPGDGFRVCRPANLLSYMRTSAGLVLDTATTAPAITALESNFYGLRAASSTTFCGMFQWVAPDDYDPSADELRIRLLCNMNGNTNTTTTISPAIYRKRPNLHQTFILNGTTYTGDGTGVALTADLGITASTAYVPILASASTDYVASTSNANTQWYEMNCDYWTDQISKLTHNRSLYSTADASIRPGDALNVTLTASAHTTDAINIYGLEIWYRSNLAFSDINSR
jgi:hypothetical protein